MSIDDATAAQIREAAGLPPYKCIACRDSGRVLFTPNERRMWFGHRPNIPATVKLGGCGAAVSTLHYPCQNCKGSECT